ncbi:uncharacterized protein LOC135109226 isoform X2 [Scylla paramamosain]|uniref:uncharacterized protein LOC135109226 isoform X2 n=1 Tax=Scylla paramamosain TaxID=85552 RepID=UPI003083E99C
MRVVVGVVAVVALVVAVAEGDSLMTRSKKYKLCTARDINMFVTQLCSGALTRMRVGRHNSHPAPGILTIRIPPRDVRGPVVSPAEIGSSYEFPSYRENLLDTQKYSPSELDAVDAPYLRPVSYWEGQSWNNYKESSAESDQWNAGEAGSAMIGLRRKRTTFGDIRQRCCTDGCYASELQSLCA